MLDLVAIRLRNWLVKGLANAVDLESYITDGAEYEGAWRMLVDDKASMRLLAASTAAMLVLAATSSANVDMVASQAAREAVFDKGTAIKAILDDSVSRAAWYNTFKIAVNDAPNTIKLKRQVFTASGTWTHPGVTDDLVGISAVCVGSGSSGNQSGSGYGGAGGGGGAIVAATVTPASVTADVTVTVGARVNVTSVTASVAGATSSFGAFVTAAGGSAAGTGSGGAGGVGGGSSSSGNWLDQYLLLAAWQVSANVKGGTGGAACTVTTPANFGGNATSANALTLGLGGSVSKASGAAYSGGGASGVTSQSSVGTDAALTAYGAGGGGASYSASALQGADSGPGLVVVHWIIS